MIWSDKILDKTVLPFIPRSWLPNHITLFRVCLVPIVAALLLTRHYEAGLVCFLFAAFTDWLDGALARTRNQITSWGKLFDPLADKLLVCVSILILIFRYLDPLVGLATVVLELTIIMAALIKKNAGVDLQANQWGKVKMTFQVLGVSFVLLSALFGIFELEIVGAGFLYMALGLGVVSLITYSV